MKKMEMVLREIERLQVANRETLGEAIRDMYPDCYRVGFDRIKARANAWMDKLYRYALVIKGRGEDGLIAVTLSRRGERYLRYKEEHPDVRTDNGKKGYGWNAGG